MQCVRETMLTMLPEMGKKSHKPSGLCCQSDTVSQKKKNQFRKEALLAQAFRGFRNL